MIDWQPIETAPWDKTVLLTGDSGNVRPHNHFIVNGFRSTGWHGGDWNDVCGTSLRDSGWVPTHWAKIEGYPV